MPPPYRFVRIYQFQAPADVPIEQRIRRVRIPNSQDWIAAMNGVIEILGNAEYWRENITGGIDPTTAASIGAALFQDYISSDGFMIGTIVAAATATAPPFTLLCDGSSHNKSDYPNLYAVLAAPYIIDSDHFSVPDLQRRALVGVGGDYTIGQAVGAESVTLTTSQMPAHSHTIAPHTHTESASAPTFINGGIEAPALAANATPGVTGPAGLVTDNAGTGDPIDIRNPAVALNYYIYAE